jgi:diguanylate cyclase (GGDEF)-like protein
MGEIKDTKACREALDATNGQMETFMFRSMELQKERELLLLGYPWEYIQAWGDTLFPTLMHPEDLAMRPFFHARLSTVRDGESLDLQYRMRDARGEWRWLRSREFILEWTDEGDPLRVLGIAEDFTSRKRDEDRLREMALVDELTGLRNRRGFLAIAEQYTRIARRQGQPYSLFFVDLDRFKRINDNCGHSEGDQALKAAAGILLKTFRSSDILCRFGGDEFAALAVDTAEYGSNILKERICRSQEDWNVSSRKPYRIEFSIGVSVFDPSRTDPGRNEADLFEEALHTADEAMYKDKAARRADDPLP